MLAPVLYEFTRWVLEQARREKIDRLYFLARDGWPAYLTAKMLCRRNVYSGECRYLHVSRYALRAAARYLDREHAADEICRGGLHVTVQTIADRMGMPQAQQELEQLLHKNSGCELTVRDRNTVRKWLHEQNGWMDRMMRSSEEQYSYAAAYLRQEGLLDPDISWAVVDSGWMGSIQQTLQMILRQEGMLHPVFGFYFGLYSIPEKADPKMYRTFYFSADGEVRRKAAFSPCVFECIFRSPQSMTIGYEKKSDRYVPVLETLCVRDRQKIGHLCAVLCRETAGIADRNIRIPVKELERRLSEFMTCPDREQAEEFGTWQFSDDVREEPGRMLAPLPPQKSAWPEGSAVRIGHHTAVRLSLIRMHRFAGEMRRQVRGKIKSRRGKSE